MTTNELAQEILKRQSTTPVRAIQELTEIAMGVLEEKPKPKKSLFSKKSEEGDS